jgi:hypothetical protein
MTAFQGAVATFALGIDAVYTPQGGEPAPVRVIARRPDTIVGFSETRIHAETATFELRASEVANPRSGDQLTVGFMSVELTAARELGTGKSRQEVLQGGYSRVWWMRMGAAYPR